MPTAALSKCLFNVCTPNYARRYRSELQSQQQYAQKYGYDYRPLALPSVRPGEAKWYKLDQFQLFLAKYDLVLLLDADCLVKENAPDICSQLVPGKWIYMARGVSGRFNSGVILAVKHERSRAFVAEVLASRRKRLLPQHVVSAEGENGHVIELANDPRFSGVVQELSYRWNNNHLLTQPDYIRHYSGPMKKWHGREQHGRSAK